ncbi:MAG: SGNH/GDSL hydrolase family protein [Halioglobus sp.]
MPRTRARERAANTVLVICSLVFAIAVMEIALRIIGFTYLTTWRYDSITGKSLLPGVEMWNDGEGRAFVRISSDGLRDSEHTLEKPANTVRIAILGDSYAEAMQVPVEQAFWRVMAEKLTQCPALAGKTIEPINFGVSGFGTAQELLTLKHKVWKYSPDIVLLAFLTGNDIRNNFRELQRGGNQPYYVHQDGELVLDDSFLKKPEAWFLGSIFGDWWFAAVPHSRVLQLLVKFSNYLDQVTKGSAREEKKIAQRMYEQGLDNEIYTPPTDPLWIEAWSVTEDLLRLMNSEVKAHDATFLLVSLSNSYQVHPDPAERQRYAGSLGVDNLLYPDRRIGQLAAQEHIPFVMLVPPLQAWAQANAECVHGFDNAEPCKGHWNEQGHRLAGEIIAADICRLVPGG